MKALIVGLSFAIAPSVVFGQSLMQRVTAGGDGTVRIRYASRPDICGGNRYIRLGENVYMAGNRGLSIMTGHFQTDDPCNRGMAETRLEVMKGRVVDVKSAVASSAGTADRDLGIVGTADVTKMFLDLLSRPDADRDERLFLALILADSATIWPDLVRLAKNTALSDERRGRALRWAGLDGEADAREPLAVFLRDATLPRKIRQGAASGLAQIDDPATTRLLTEFVRAPGDSRLRAGIVHMVNDRGGAMSVWRTMAADASIDEEVRGAIFLVLSNTDNPQDGRLLRSLLPSVQTKKLRGRLLHAVSERDDAESGKWLLEVGISSEHDYETRKQALFWAGQSETPVKDVVAAYDRLDDRRLKEYMIFVIQDREESEATDKLISIARSDPDKENRKKAMFWLGESKDPRAASFIREVLQ